MRVKAFLTAALALFSVPAAAQQAPLTATFESFTYSGDDSAYGFGAAREGEYGNPILQGFYPDPSVTRVGDTFYLVHSTFSYFPGIPVWRSKNLVDWEQIGNAIDRPDMLDFKQLGMSRGVFAPTIQAKDGIFYILNTCVDCGGNFVITAKNPAGPWSDPVWLPALEGGIDPSLFFDDDGRAWIVNNGPPEGKPEYQGHRAIWIQEFDLKTLKSFGPRTVLVNGGVDFSKKPIWIEGPHIFRKDGWYYLSCAEGGTAEGHSQVMLRSKNVTGPYLPNPNNPILTQRDLPGDRTSRITSAGHAELVSTPDGKWWATFLAVRPYEGDFYNTGRETFLLPVEWVDGWPMMTRDAIPVTHKRPGFYPSDRPLKATNGPLLSIIVFAGAKLLPENWMMLRNPREQWYALGDDGLKLTARPVGLGDYGNPSFLARRQQHLAADAETTLRFNPAKDGDRAGLAVFQNDDFWAFVGIGMVGGKRVVLVEARKGPNDSARGVIIATAPLGGDGSETVRLSISARGADYRFSYAVGGKSPIELGRLDGHFLSTKTAGGFIGATLGPYAYSAR
ncbi:glycoside hydrolase family 43 protein [Sphingomonas sp. LB-2]|uniref:glycoside hydrolase family 43 protein n=1 Tax=Sphingomonas caeni TaxID=2984949 RepID=UPI00222EB1CC|nr:glycoside hydrolase family 43 protein [Sphingomonas caeni]MCW3847422.1 glycoside hydrolase family 43 protein [Sphingomonas caeni]